ncbi:MAG: hypothetical protein ACFFBD_22040, partial [Candidatus Hodarchaeota archaeon]
LLVFVAFVALTALGLQESRVFLVQSSPQGVILTINYAYYHDLDRDYRRDDIWTEFTLRTASGQREDISSYVRLYLYLPSGRRFFTDFYLYGTYSRVQLGTAWFNTAIESGWYCFIVYVTAVGNNWIQNVDEAGYFDPPTKAGPGTPYCSIYIL